MKRAAYLTLGCRVNQYETQVIREQLSQMGFEEAAADSPCDLYVVNTCAVTGESTRKGRQTVRRILRLKEENPNAVVCVCGCLTQGVDGEDELFSKVDVLCGNVGKGTLAPVLSRLCDTPSEERKRVDLRKDISKIREYEPMSLCRSHNARAFVKIEDGCNSFCSYCYVPYVRGRVRSRPAEEVVEEVRRLCENGYREVVLTGIETGSYGEDLQNGENLITLVSAIHQISGLERIRFGSLKPTVLTADFCREMASLPKVMPHFHLSLQSGSSSVLERMGRRYRREDEWNAIENVFGEFPDAGLSADFICGFPGETEAEFLESASLVRDAGLLHTHIFPFSPRKGTRAAAMEPMVAEEVKKDRCARLLAVAKESSLRFAQKREGREYRVLCERVRNGAMQGYTENFLYTQIPGEHFCVGEIYSVRLGKESRFSVETLIVSGNEVK